MRRQSNTLAALGFVETVQSMPDSDTCKVASACDDALLSGAGPFHDCRLVRGEREQGPTELRMTQIGSACWEEPAADNPAAPSERVFALKAGPRNFLSVLQDLETPLAPRFETAFTPSTNKTRASL